MVEKKNAVPTDLAQFDAAVRKQEEGILVPIKGMDGKTGLGFSIRVAGPDSTRAQEAQEEFRQEMLDSESMAVSSARDLAVRELRYLAKITLDFVPDERTDGTTPEHAVILDGAPLPYNEDNALKLYQRFRFIKEQVDRAAGKRAAFLKG